MLYLLCFKFCIDLGLAIHVIYNSILLLLLTCYDSLLPLIKQCILFLFSRCHSLYATVGHAKNRLWS